MADVQTSFQVVDVCFDHHLLHDTLGTGSSHPSISWKVASAPPDFKQEKYELELYGSNGSGLLKHPAYYSRVYNSAQSTFTPFPDLNELKSRQGVYVRVRVWSKGIAEPSGWSEAAYLETGLLYDDDWKCERIAASWKQDPNIPRPEELYRKTFTSKDAQISRARLYITAQGLYEVEINGSRIGDHFLAPGWTAYAERLQYQTYDVKEWLTKGSENCIGVRVAEGWFCGRLGWAGGRRNIWGERTALIVQIEIEYEDGTSETVSSDGSWEVAEGPIRRAEIYDGEKYDSSYEIPGWSTTALVQNGRIVWSPAEVLKPSPAEILPISMEGAPIRRFEAVSPIELITTPSGKRVVDFGQNLAGYTRIKHIKGKKGDKVSLWHAEVLEHGELGRRPLRVCEACDEYTLRGAPEGESWEPRFTFHGFRYVQVDGWPEEAKEDIIKSLEAVVCHTEMERVGEFSCSNSRLNQLNENVRWSMRGNFLSVPTDCPQRDERMGWTGDLALFAPTATSLYNCTGMLSCWLRDVYTDQDINGGIPTLVSPNVLIGNKDWQKLRFCAIWNDVIIMAPWALYEATGNVSVLKTGYSHMTMYMDKVPRDQAGNTRLWDPSLFQLGDWLDPDAPPDKPSEGKTDTQLVSNAFLVHCLDLMTKISAILGKDGDSRFFSLDAKQARSDFAREYITPNGRMASDSQTAYALAICFDLFSSTAQRVRAGARLADIVRRNEFKIGTGFAGTPYICEALVQTEQTQVAYRMLLEEKCPSWLYPVTMGATTTWERWDSMVPDGTINPGEMTSFNHYALGAVASFLYERIGGLRCLEAGWKKCRAEPVLGADLTHAMVSRVTPHGLVSCAWEITERGTEAGKSIFKLIVKVPLGTTMEVVLPGDEASDIRTVSGGQHSFSVPYEIKYSWPPKRIPWNPNIPVD